NIDVFDLKKFKYIKHGKIPIGNDVKFHCFILKNENTKINKMILFHKNEGLIITFDEDKNLFHFNKVTDCTSMRPVYYYGYTYVSDFILFFGGSDEYIKVHSKEIYKYSIIENKWTKFEQDLPFSLRYCVAMLSKDNKFIHIVGGYAGKKELLPHLKIKITELMKDIGINKLFIVCVNITSKKTNTKEKKEINIITNYWFVHILSRKDGLMILTLLFSDLWLCLFASVLCYHVSSVKFSPNGTTIVSSSYDDTIQIWDVSSGKQIQILKGHKSWINYAEFSPDGNMIVYINGYNKLEGHSEAVKRVQFSQNGKNIVSCSRDATIRIWDLESGQQRIIQRNKYSEFINDIGFSPDGEQIVSDDGFAITILDMKSGITIKKLNGHQNYLNRVQYSKNGKVIFSCSEDHTIRVWDAVSGKQLKKIVTPSIEPLGLQDFPDGQTIAVWFDDKTIRLYDVESRLEIQTLIGHSKYITEIDISPDGNMIVSSSYDETIRLWQYNSQKHTYKAIDKK
ncbi:Pfs, NACHT and WD domain protein, partial [Reticulomyxa filosa]